MKVLVWQWGRRGAGPLMAVALSRALAELPGTEVVLSLSTTAELLTLPGAPRNDLPVQTYKSRLGFVRRLLQTPWTLPGLIRSIRMSGADVALCAMPAPLDFVMASALRRAGIPYAVMVHDAQLHPGDAFPMQIALQRRLLARADLLFALSTHVAGQLRAQGLRPGQPLLQASLPPFVFGPVPPPVRSHGGRLRLLSFGRLMPYKGLDLLAEAMTRLDRPDDFELRVVGAGPDSPDLARLRALPKVTVENRWVPEGELNELLGWADALVLTHREASQSGVAAAALAARRLLVATRVGGLAEQLAGQDAAILCTPDPDSIANAIARLPDHPAPSAAPATNWTTTTQLVQQGLRQLLPPQAEAATAGISAASAAANLR